MKPLLIAAGVLAFQMFVFGGYFTLSTIMRGRAVPMLLWLAASVVASLFAFAAVKSVCHECLTAPSVAQCARSGPGVPAIDVELHSTRVGGYIVERQMGVCTLYWHENNTHGN
jgi:hypothetical protein